MNNAKLYCEELVDDGLLIKTYGICAKFIDDYLLENKSKTYRSLHINDDVEIDEEMAKYISNNIKANCVFVSRSLNDMFSNKEKIKDILKGLNLLEKNGYNIEIHETGVAHSVDDVKNTIKQIEEVSSLIENFKDKQGQELSVAEKFVFAYVYVRNRLKYKAESKKDHWMESRTFVGSMNGKLVVCVGFAAVLQELCVRLGISAKATGATMYPTFSSDENHEICVLNINDDKHNVRGTYYSDPTNGPTRNCLVREKELMAKFLTKSEDIDYEEVTPPVEDFNKYLNSVEKATDFKELSDLHLKITNNITKNKIKIYLDKFKDFRRNKFVVVEDNDVARIFDKYSNYKTLIPLIVIKKELEEYFKDFKNIKKSVSTIYEGEFDFGSKKIPIEEATRVNFNEIINNISTDDIKKVKDLAKSHRRIYSLKKGNPEELQESVLSV